MRLTTRTLTVAVVVATISACTLGIEDEEQGLLLEERDSSASPKAVADVVRTEASSSGDPQAEVAATCTAGLVCGEVWNSSLLWVMVAGGDRDTEKGWCWADNAPRYGSSFTCQVPAPKILDAGDESDDGYFRDTDAFRADAGCLTKFWNNSPIQTEWFSPFEERVEERRGLTRHKWIKVFDNDAIQITYQSCSGTPAKYYVDTFATAYGYQDEYCLGDGGSGSDARCNRDGELYAATNYVFCKKWGDKVQFGSAYNHWWLLTDLDKVYSGRDGRAFVSAYYLSRWGNDEAKDNSGRTIPDC